MDDTVDHNVQGEGGEPPRELLDLLPHPREVREGQAPHGRRSGPLHGQDFHGGSLPLRREEDVGLGDGERVQGQDRVGQGDVGRAQGVLPRVQGLLRPPYCPRSSRRTTWCLSSSPTEPRVGPGDPRGGAPPSGIPPESTSPT